MIIAGVGIGKMMRDIWNIIELSNNLAVGIERDAVGVGERLLQSG